MTRLIPLSNIEIQIEFDLYCFALCGIMRLFFKMYNKTLHIELKNFTYIPSGFFMEVN